MAGLKSESLLWIEQLHTLQGLEQKKPSRLDLKKGLNLGESHITILRNLNACFDASAIEKIQSAAQSNPPYILSFSSAKAFQVLKNRIPEVHSALDVVLAQRLATAQIKALVAWMVGGKPAAEFDPHAKLPPRAKRAPSPADLMAGELEAPQQVKAPLDIDHDQLTKLNNKAKAEKARGDGQTKHQKALADHLQKITSRSPLPASNAAHSADAPDPGIAATVFMDWLAGIPFIARVKAKVKKGKALTGGEKLLLWFHKMGELTGHGLKALLKLIKPLFKIVHWILKILIDTLKEVGLYKYVKAVFIFAVFIAALWFAWEAFNYGFMRPVEMIWSKIHVRHAATEESNANANADMALAQPSLAPQLAASAQVSASTQAPAPKKITTPLASYQPAVSFQPAVYNEKLLDQEIAAVPHNSLITAFPLAPDETMPGDLAASRLQDLTNTDKYTMKLGGSTQKIESVSPSATNFILNYKSADALGGFLSGSGEMNFFWEDVAAIHTDIVEKDTVRSSELDSSKLKTSNSSLLTSNPEGVFYQCSLIVSGAKDALTIQCATADDLKHLVSTMEYFIRHSRLGHDTALGGMPYTCLGVRLTDPSAVDTLWAGSPMDKAGLRHGDNIWSLDADAYQPISRNNLEAALRTLPPGRHDLYVVSDADWAKALAASNADRSKPFNPQRRKLALVLP